MAVALALLLTPLLLLSPASAAAGTSFVGVFEPTSWSNGVVLCNFANGTPAVVVSASGAVRTGLFTHATEMEEVSPSSGFVAASANLSSVAWSASNRSGPDSYDLSYAVSVPIAVSGSPPSTVGMVALRVDFVLPIYAPSPSTSINEVAMNLNVSGWAWQHAGDRLALTFALSPAFGSEHLVLPPKSGAVVSSVSNQSGDTLEYFAMGLAGNVSGPSQPSASVGMTPEFALPATGGTLTLVFSSGGEFSTLLYTAHIGVVVPATLAGLPLYDYVLVGGSAALIAGVVGLGMRRVRRHPADLTYVEEET